jgi:hypothetical protein
MEPAGILGQSALELQGYLAQKPSVADGSLNRQIICGWQSLEASHIPPNGTEPVGIGGVQIEMPGETGVHLWLPGHVPQILAQAKKVLPPIAIQSLELSQALQAVTIGRQMPSGFAGSKRVQMRFLAQYR